MMREFSLGVGAASVVGLGLFFFSRGRNNTGINFLKKETQPLSETYYYDKQAKRAFQNKTVLITGGSRGIGQAISLRFAEAGANIGILAKNDARDNAPSSLEITAQQIRQMGGNVLALDVDLTDTDSIKLAVDKVAKEFGGIDVVINNLSAFCFKGSEEVTPKEFDGLISASGRATFFVSQACIPYLKKSVNPHILNIAPPMQHIAPEWFVNHPAFSLSKYTMSLCTMGLAAEFKGDGIAVNGLWPQTTIATTTISDNFRDAVYEGSRLPTIMADAAYEIALRKSKECTGVFFIDETVLREVGVTDFSRYAVNPKVTLIQDLFVPPTSHSPMTPLTKELYMSPKARM